MRRRGEAETGEERTGSDRWLVSYADFITLMFAFFAVLYATSQKDSEKSKEFQESIKRYLIKAGSFGESGPQLGQGIKDNSPIAPPIETFNATKIESAKALDEAEAFLEAHLSKEEQKRFVLDLSADDWGVRVVIPAKALFPPGSEKFKPEALAFVNKLSDLLNTTKRKILIEGHVSAKELGRYPSTWEFASARALNLLRYMQSKQALAPSRLAAVAFGDSRPIVGSNDRSLDSRLEIVLLNADMEL